VTTPSIAVIVPAYNAATTIERTLEALRAQSIEDWEAIVVDDGSVDDTASVAGGVDDVRIRIVAIEHTGVSAARNRGLHESRAPVITFVDADDVPARNWLQRLVEPFQAEHIGIVCCRGLRVFPDATATPVEFHEDPRFGAVRFQAGSFAARRDLVTVGFDERLAFGENTDIGNRLLREAATRGFEVATVDEALIRWHVDPSREDARDADRLEAAEVTLRTHGETMSRRTVTLHERLAAVNAARIGHLRSARSHARAAIALEPLRWTNWATFAGSWVPLLGDRWSRPSADRAPRSLRDGPTTSPRVSVLMPVFNGEDTIEDAIESVLRQDLEDLELVVVDDGSTDRTATILDRWRTDDRVTVLTNAHNEGLVAALNRGLTACRGELVARLDADDLAAPTRLQRQVAAFDGDPGVALCATAYDRLSSSGELLKHSTPPSTHAELAAALLAGNRLHHSSVMFRCAVVRSVGGYDPDWFPVEDYDLWLNVLERGRYVGLRTVESFYVQRAAGISATMSATQAQRAAARAQRYRADLTGRAGARGTSRQVLEIARAALSIRRRLRRRRISTTGLDRQALRTANHVCRNGSMGGSTIGSRLGRAALVLALAPRLAIVGRLARRA
jgi:glycosyltransferase involved in cell wall biosynthesis